MKLLGKIISSKNFLPLFIVIFFAVLAARSLIFQSGYFKMHDDLQMMRQLQIEKCFLDGQIPCRWVPDMGYGFGFPLFNFYPPLPYLIGEAFRILGFSFVNTVKLNFSLSILASGVAMYFLAKIFFGRIGGVLSSVFYIWAPYHAVDVYVRGALNESWALVWFPLIFLFSYKLIACRKKQLKRWIILLALAYFALFASHNLMVLIFTPFFGIWALIHLWQKNAWSRLSQLVFSGIWALGLAAFFTLPALAENSFTYVRSQLQGYFEYAAHFVNLNQLFISRFWGYEGSAWGIENDGMSFQVGHLHWILSLLVGFLLFMKFLFNKGNMLQRLKSDVVLVATGYLLMLGWFSAYMAHTRSTWVYQLITPLTYIQFPWRFLTITIFAFSFIVGALPGILDSWKKKKHWIVNLLVTPNQLLWFLFFSAMLVFLNWNYFRPEGGRMGPLTDEEKFSGVAWELQQAGGIIDYLPLTADLAPTAPQTVVAEVMEGEGAISNASQGTYWALFNANIESDEALVRINIFDFPDWRAFIRENSNSREVEIFIPDNEAWGRIWISLPQGEHLVHAQLFNTPIRSYSNVISILSWIALIFYAVYVKNSRGLKDVLTQG